MLYVPHALLPCVSSRTTSDAALIRFVKFPPTSKIGFWLHSTNFKIERYERVGLSDKKVETHQDKMA
jgi:hypothetical protein